MEQLVDLDRELFERTINDLKGQLDGETPRLLLDWLLREHKIEVDALKAEVARLKEKSEVQEAVLVNSIVQDRLVSRLMDEAKKVFVPVEDDSPCEPMPTAEEEAEAMRRVNDMLDEVGEKPLTKEELPDDDDEELPPSVPCCPKCGRILAQAGDDCPNGCVRPIDASPKRVDEPSSGSTDRAPSGFQKHQLVLNPAPIDTTPPEPYKPEGPVSEAEKKRIRVLIGDQRCERLTGTQYVDVVLRRMKKQTVSQIATAIGLPPANCGAYLRSADRHVTNLAAHPREEWREAYLEVLKESIDSARGQA